MTMPQPEWRKERKNPHSKLKKPPTMSNSPCKVSLDEKLAIGLKQEEMAWTKSGKVIRKGSLSCSPHGSMKSEGVVSQVGTTHSRYKDKISDMSDSPMAAIQSFGMNASNYEINESVKEEETIGQSLLLFQNKGKNKRGSQELLSDLGDNSSVVIPINVEQRLQV